MTVVSVKPDLIRWARERSGLTVADLLKSFPKLPDWESGSARLTLRQLEALARKTFTPLGFFFLPQPPEDKLPIPDFRTVKDEPVKKPSPNLLETIQICQRRQEWMREFLYEQGQDPLPFVGAVTIHDNPVDVAADIRRVLGHGPEWASLHATWHEALRAFRISIEEAGVLVSINGVVGNNGHRKLDPNEFRGFILLDKLAPLIFVNGSDAKAAQMFTMAHELAHLWLGCDGVFNLVELQPSANAVETFCNQVAAEFLIPAVELRACWPQASAESEPFQVLARRFKVSPLVAARRVLDLGFISKQDFLKFYAEYQRDERRKAANRPSGGDFYATQDLRIGRRFAHAVVRATLEGRLLFREAYQLTGLCGKTFDRYAKSLGFHLQA
ncbi:MAG TPA: ImmA/IrrE family metallo-endopeptidase [Candidatus Paceibacterota bacterium]|nr:ImmA/IrrE family metallo-endopeptidase [Candidatus Paceibacterota bacterium]